MKSKCSVFNLLRDQVIKGLNDFEGCGILSYVTALPSLVAMGLCKSRKACEVRGHARHLGTQGSRHARHVARNAREHAWPVGSAI